MSDWQDRILTGIADRKRPPRTTEKGRSGAVYPSEFNGSLNRLHLHLDTVFIALLDRAARKRNVNRSSYMRRALAVLISHDLGIPVEQVLHHSPAQGRYGGVQDRRGQRDHAEGIEQWCPHPGCAGKHFVKN